MIISFSKSYLYYLQAGLSVTKPVMPGDMSENQDQPSPISVLEPPFEDDNRSLEASGNMKPDNQGILSLSLTDTRSHFLTIFLCLTSFINIFEFSFI